MKILVTGRDGQVARSLAERANGRELVFAARPELDLAQPASIERVIAQVAPDLIISAAAYTAVDRAEEEPEAAMAINGIAPGVIGRAAARTGSRVLHLSTDYVFDGRGDRPWREDDPTQPGGAYGRSKLAGEEALAASGAHYAIVRTAWVYSPFGSNFVKTMLRLAGARDELTVVADQYGNPTSALDIADALFAVSARWEVEPGRGQDEIYHFAGSGFASWAEFAQAIFAASAARGGPNCQVRGISSSEYLSNAARPANSRLDCSRFMDTFGHRAPPWEKSLKVTLDRLLG